MLLNLLFSLYILFVSYTAGLISWKLAQKIKLISSIPTTPTFFSSVICGLSTLTCVLGFVSLFHAIDATVQYVGIAAATAFALTNLRHYRLPRLSRPDSSTSMLLITISALFAAIVVLCSASNILHYSYDTGLYHAGTIKWITTFKAVKGLGNIDGRLAFNSHFYLLSAFFTFTLSGKSISPLNSFLSLLFVSFLVTNIFACIACKQGQHRTGLLLLLLVSYVYLFDFVIYSQYADMSACIFVFFAVTSLLQYPSNYCLANLDMTLLTAFAALVTAVLFKLSVLLVVLLPVSYCVVQISSKRTFSNALKVAAVVLVLLFPWVTRNAVLSGYLVYPFPAVDVFSFDWKIPLSKVVEEKYVTTQYSMAVYRSGWMEKSVLGFLLGSAVVVLALAKKMTQQERLLYGSSLFAAAFSFLQAPSLRFVYPCSFVCIGLACAVICQQFGGRVLFVMNRCFLAVALIIGIHLLRGPVYLLRHTNEIRSDHLLIAEQYETVEIQRKACRNFDVFVPAIGNQCWGADLLCIDPRFYDKDLELRGSGLEDGFRYRKHL